MPSEPLISLKFIEYFLYFVVQLRRQCLRIPTCNPHDHKSLKETNIVYHMNLKRNSYKLEMLKMYLLSPEPNIWKRMDFYMPYSILCPRQENKLFTLKLSKSKKATSQQIEIEMEKVSLENQSVNIWGIFLKITNLYT